ncbi:MAG: hypothetical protein XXXNARYT_001189 [Candidatus Accumulibacter regalis]
MLQRSARTVASGSTSPCLATAVDSPVNADSMACKSLARNRRRSAGTLSPAASRTTSPGTSSVEGRRCLQPSRRTVTSLLTERASAARASSARPSWMKPIAALIRVTPKITPESTHSPRKAVTAPATSSTSTSGWTNCSAKRSSGPLPAFGVIRFSPCKARRLRTSLSANPSSQLACRRVAASSAAMKCQATRSGVFAFILPSGQGRPLALEDRRFQCILLNYRAVLDSPPRTRPLRHGSQAAAPAPVDGVGKLDNGQIAGARLRTMRLI